MKYLQFIIFMIVVQSNFVIVTSQGVYNLCGTIKLNDSTSVDQCEVDIKSWFSYYSWMLVNKGLDSAQKTLPDSNFVDKVIWSCLFSNKSKFNKTIACKTGEHLGYFSSKCKCTDKSKNDYLDFPITGLTYNQVNEFCKWRTEVLGGSKYVYKLPSPEECVIFPKNSYEIM